MSRKERGGRIKMNEQKVNLFSLLSLEEEEEFDEKKSEWNEPNRNEWMKICATLPKSRW